MHGRKAHKTFYVFVGWGGRWGGAERVVPLQPRVWALLKSSWGDQQRIPAPPKVMISIKRRGGRC